MGEVKLAALDLFVRAFSYYRIRQVIFKLQFIKIFWFFLLYVLTFVYLITILVATLLT